MTVVHSGNGSQDELHASKVDPLTMASAAAGMMSTTLVHAEGHLVAADELVPEIERTKHGVHAFPRTEGQQLPCAPDSQAASPIGTAHEAKQDRIRLPAFSLRTYSRDAPW